MPFQLPEPTVTIAIEDGGPYHGVEVEVRQSAAWSLYRDISRFRNEFLDAEGVELEDAALQNLYGLFAEYLIAWNITDHRDAAIPATVEGLNRLPPSLALQIIGLWADVGVGYVPGPLPEGSPPTAAPTPPTKRRSRKS